MKKNLCHKIVFVSKIYFLSSLDLKLEDGADVDSLK